MLVQVVQQHESLRCEEFHILQLDADLLFLVLAESEAIDGLHQEVDMHLALERAVQLWEARGGQSLLSTVLQVAQDVALVVQMIYLLLLFELVELDHLKGVVAHGRRQGQDRLNWSLIVIDRLV